MKKTKLIIDLLRLRDPHSGLGQVMSSYAKNAIEAKDTDIELCLLVPKNQVGRFGNEASYLTPNFLRRHFPCLNRGFDVWHATHQDVAFLPPKNTTFVLTIHDLNFLYEKSASKIKKRKKRLQKLIDRSTQIVAISNTTKNEIETHFQIGNKKVEVIYNGVEIQKVDNPTKPISVTQKNFLFAIGVFKPNKNYESLVLMMQDLPNETLVIAGNCETPYGIEIAKKIKDLGISNIILTGIASESERYWLFSNCKALLFPSTNEGMGLPAIEAMLFGKAVFASNTSCIPEFCQDKAYYFQSFQKEDMAATLKNGLNDFNNNPEKAQKLIAYAQTFSWKENVRKYFNLFRQ